MLLQTMDWIFWDQFIYVSSGVCRGVSTMIGNDIDTKHFQLSAFHE